MKKIAIFIIVILLIGIGYHSIQPNDSRDDILKPMIYIDGKLYEISAIKANLKELDESYRMIGKIKSVPNKDVIPKNDFEATLIIEDQINSPIYQSNDTSHIYVLYDHLYRRYDLYYETK